MEKTYLTSREKIDLSLEIAEREKELLSHIDYENGYSLYVGIPFCPTNLSVLLLYLLPPSGPGKKKNGPSTWPLFLRSWIMWRRP